MTERFYSGRRDGQMTVRDGIAAANKRPLPPRAKGGPSPNPRGRPRKEQSMLPDVRKAFELAINKRVAVPRGDKTVLMTRVEIGLEQTPQPIRQR